MNALVIVAESYFDGAHHHARGPFTIEVVDGRIEEILAGDRSDGLATRHRHLHGEEVTVLCAPFVMPGLVEAHCHLFLDGAELDFEARKKYLTAPRETMLAVGRRSLRQNLDAGVTLVRDAGDVHGINTQLKAESADERIGALSPFPPSPRDGGVGRGPGRGENLAHDNPPLPGPLLPPREEREPTLGHGGQRLHAACANTPGCSPAILSAGRALRKAGRYGSFMAIEATDAASIVRAIHELAPTAGQLKILLTGIIDFERGQMKGGVQFDLEETRLIVRTARELGLRTFAHCSGLDGLKIAVEAGIDSIEHGFFMERDILRGMADKGIAWVPTFSPVYFQYERPELAGWSSETVAGLWGILERHFEHIALANELGVPIVAGSDAGSYGVPHGRGLIDELLFLRRSGLPIEAVLAAATSVPRRRWGCEPADIHPGNRVDLIVLAGSPFADIENLRHVRTVLRGNSRVDLGGERPVERAPEISGFC